MAKVRISDEKDVVWTKIRDSFSEDMLSGVDESVLESRLSLHQRGGANEPQMTEADYLPGACIAVHSHSEDEIIYVASGSIGVGSRELHAGSSIFIAANTFYGFSAGPNGVRLAIFRTRGNDEALSEEHLTHEPTNPMQGGQADGLGRGRHAR